LARAVEPPGGGGGCGEEAPGGRNRHRKLLDATWRETKRSLGATGAGSAAGMAKVGFTAAASPSLKERDREWGGGKGKGTKSGRTEQNYKLTQLLFCLATEMVWRICTPSPAHKSY
jgi:hypothetical protein